MSIAKSLRDLNVYKLGRQAALEVFNVTKKFPSEERYSPTDQIRRSSRAVNAMIAAAWARRRYKAAFISKLDEALEECMETQAWIDHAQDCGYVSVTQSASMDGKWQSIGGMINSMINRAADFCKFASDKDYRDR